MLDKFHATNTGKITISSELNMPDNRSNPGGSRDDRDDSLGCEDVLMHNKTMDFRVEPVTAGQDSLDPSL